MTRDELHAVVADALAAIAPEADLSSVPPDAVLRDELDLDSMDLLSLYGKLHERLGVDIPEADYPKLATLGGMLDHLERAVGR